METLGWLMLAIPFVILFFILWRIDSLKVALIVYCGIAAVFFWIIASIKVINGWWMV